MNPLPESLEGQFLRHSTLFSEAPTQDPHVSFGADTLVTQLMRLIFPGFTPALPTVPMIVLLLRGTFLGPLLFGGWGGWGAL